MLVNMAKKPLSKSNKVKIGNNPTQRLVLFMFVAVIAVFGSIALTRSFAAAGGSLYMTPATGTYKVGDTITVNIRENSGSDEVLVTQADVLFVASQLQYVSMTCNGAFVDVAPPPTVTPGQVSTTCGSFTNKTGDQQVATATFKVLTSGPTTLSFAPTSIVYKTSDSSNAAGSMSGATYKLAKARGGGKH